jgi:pimeloyl-ACP methyl ester carboxylesterase
VTLEILRAGAPSSRPPLVFIHGSFSGAWVWQERFLPYFAAAGWECVALSLSGHGSSRGEERLDRFGLDDFVADVAEVVAGLGRPPVVIGHSLGGAVAQRFVTRHRTAGLVLLTAVPPGGFGPITLWMGWRHPRFLWQMTRLETTGSVDPEVMAEHLFSPTTPPADVHRFLARLQRESRRVVTDVLLPLHVARPPGDYPTLVLGGDDDVFIPPHALHATAAHWHAQLVIQPGVPHVMMLDALWERPAEAILGWLEERFPITSH